MEERKGVTLNGMNTVHMIYVLLAVAIVFSCTYLTRHYFDTHFSTELQGTGICNMSEFFNCKAATTSPLAQIFYVPISVLGLMFGLFLLGSSIFPSEGYEKTLKTLSAINLVGCILLFIYSLVALGGLCPVCTFYYLCSGGVYFLFHKHGVEGFGVDPKFAGIIGVLGIIVSVLFSINVKKEFALKDAKEKVTDEFKEKVVKSFNDLKDYGDPKTQSEFKIHMATNEFSSAPIRISIFSSYSCPHCALFVAKTHDFIEQYKDKINIQYFYFISERARVAREASYVSSCAKDNFAKVHDHIFANQRMLSSEWVKDYADDLGVTECVQKSEIIAIPNKHIEIAEQYKIESTPTIIINGKKIEGNLPGRVFYSIFDYILNGK